MAIFLPIVSKFDDKGINNAVFSISKLGATAANAAAGGLAVLGAATVASIKAFADFDAEMTKSLAIMGNVSDSLRDEMADAAREVAKTTTFSANEAAEAYFFLASAGLSAADSIAAMPQVAAFAQAGMFDLATATSLLADAQSAMGLRSDDAAENMENLIRVSDVLVKANILANASVQEFSESLTNKAAASMRALNIPLEEGVAVLATFAAAGIKGSEAGTMFNATIRGLTNGVQRNAEDFARLNVEVFNSQGEMNNMADIVAQLESALNGLSVEQQRAELTALGFTEETLAGTLALLGNSEAIRGYEAALVQAGGTTEEVATKQLETLNAQIALIKSAFVDLGIEIGSRLEPVMIELTAEVQRLLDEMVASPEFEQFIIELTIAMQELLPSLIELLPPLTELAMELVPLLIDLIPILSWFMNLFAGIIEGLVGGFQNLETEVNTFFGVAEGGITIVDRIRGAFDAFDRAIARVVESIREAWRAFKAFLDLTSGKGGNLNLNVPKLAEGGIVTRPTLAMIGEGGESEAVIPLSKMSQFGFGAAGRGASGGANITINVNAGMGTNGAKLGEEIVSAIKRYERTSGPVFAKA
jgi:TP901 family phage tail tape measure protein